MGFFDAVRTRLFPRPPARVREKLRLDASRDTVIPLKTVIAAVLIAALTGCASAESIERERRAKAACTERGGVWHQELRPSGVYTDAECVSPQEARRRDERRWAEEEREKDRQAVLQQACILSGGTWYGWPTGCVGGRPSMR
jgi:hypothetical protein